MFDFIKNLEEQNIIPDCQSVGVCTFDPALSALNMLLTNELRQITFYIVKAKEFGWENLKVMNRAIEYISIEILNTNFCEKEFMEAFRQLLDLKAEVKKKYYQLCKNNPSGCESINTPVEIDINTKNTIGKLIKEGEKMVQIKDKYIEPDKMNLFELIILVSRINARKIEQIKNLEPDFNDFDFEIIRFFSLTSFPTTRIEKLKRRLLEFSRIAFRIQKKLHLISEKHYGRRTSANTLTSTKKGKSILVSGSDLSELEGILEAIGDRKINVYTNNALIIAHSYPKFQKYKNLIGHLGNKNTQSDFTNFQGVIHITKNASLKIDSLYRGIIYSSEIVSPRGIIKIKDKNYEPLIEAALNHVGFEKEEDEKFVNIEYDFLKIEKITPETKEAVIFVGNSKNVNFLSKIGNRIMINVEYPNEAELLGGIAEKVHKNLADSIIFFTQCTPEIINIIISLLGCGFKEIYLSQCPYATINPHIIESLENNFEIRVIK